MAKPIGTLGNVDSLTVAGRTFVDPVNSGLIILGGRSLTSTRSTTLRKGASSSGYQVTTGKTYTIYAAIAQHFTTTLSASPSSFLGYADNDVGNNSATALTNPVYMFGDVNAALLNLSYSGLQPIPIFFPVVALKYVFATNNTGVHEMVYVYGYEA